MTPDLTIFARTLAHVCKAEGRKRKRALMLRGLRARPATVRYLFLVLSDHTYGMTSKDARRVRNLVRDRLEEYSPHSVVELLYSIEYYDWPKDKRHKEWAAFVLKHSRDERVALNRIMDRDLKCGLSVDELREIMEEVSLYGKRQYTTVSD